MYSNGAVTHRPTLWWKKIVWHHPCKGGGPWVGSTGIWGALSSLSLLFWYDLGSLCCWNMPFKKPFLFSIWLHDFFLHPDVLKLIPTHIYLYFSHLTCMCTYERTWAYYTKSLRHFGNFHRTSACHLSGCTDAVFIFIIKHLCLNLIASFTKYNSRQRGERWNLLLGS